MKRWSLLFVSCVAAWSCSKDSSSTNANDSVTVGTLTSVSGDLASLGLEFNDATTLAIEEINAAGGVLGRPLKLAVQDDGTTVEGAKVGYRKLLDAKVPMILGPTTSEQVLALQDLIASGGVPTIGRTTTADSLTTLADNGLFFRLTPSDVHQAKLIAKLVSDQKVEKLCIVKRHDTYGDHLAAAVSDILKATTQTTITDYNPSSSDLNGVIDRCSALVCPPGDAGAGDGGAACAQTDPSKVGLLLITFIADGALILDDAARKGWSARRNHYFFSDGIYDRGLLKLVSDVSNLEGGLGTSPSGPDPATPAGERLRRFQTRYRQRFGKDPSVFVENAYDAAYVAAMAMEISKSVTSGTAIRDAIPLTSAQGGTKVEAGDWAGIRAAIASKTPVDFEGASGPCDFDQNGDIKPPYTYVVWKIANGEISVDHTETIAQ